VHQRACQAIQPRFAYVPRFEAGAAHQQALPECGAGGTGNGGGLCEVGPCRPGEASTPRHNTVALRVPGSLNAE